MKRAAGMVLLVALAVELVNFFLLAIPVDVDFPAYLPWYEQLRADQWVILHLAALQSLDWFEKIAGCHQGNVIMGCRRVDQAAIFACGYLTTLVLLAAITYATHLIVRLVRQRSSRVVS